MPGQLQDNEEVGMTKLSEYVEIAATQYVQETASEDLDACWIAEFFQDSGLQDDHPRQDVVAFFDLVQKALTEKFERAGKRGRGQLARIRRRARPRAPGDA
jgi:energy-converting hydrogenase A subunit M